MKTFLISLSLLLFFSGINSDVFSQINGYTFSYSTGTYTQITGTQLTTQDDYTLTVTLPFTFTYMGTAFVQASICTNGWLALGSTASASYSNDLCTQTSTDLNKTCPFWDDIYTPSGGTVQYTTLGVTPNRIFIAQWQNCALLSGSGDVTFQVRLYETTNVFAFIYGPQLSPPTAVSGSIGYNDAVGGTGHFVSITPGPPPTFSTSACNNAICCQPVNGTTYTFSPFTTAPQISFCRNGLNKAIFDLGTTYDTISVSGFTGNVTDVNVKIDTVIHTFDSDLDFALLHLSPTDTIIFQVGLNGQNFIGTILNDSATIPIAAGIAPFTGSFVPSKPLSQFNTLNPNGLWILKIHDGFAGDIGTLKGWCLSVISSGTYTPAPAAPILVSPSNGANCISLTPLLDWSDVTGATSYSVQVSTNSGFSPTVVNVSGLTSSQYTVPASILSYNTLYYWRANATNAGGPGPYSSVFTFTTTLQPPTLSLPANNAICQSLTPLIDWSDVTGATSYGLQVSTNSGFTTFVINVSGLAASQYNVPASILSNNVIYYWRTTASNSVCTSGFSSVFNFRTAVASPALLLPPNNATNVSLTPLLDWTDVTDDLRGAENETDLRGAERRSNPTNETDQSELVPSYRVQVANNPGFSNPVLDTSGLAQSQVTVPSGRLIANTLYYWHVRASDAGCDGAYSTTFQFTTQAGNPPAGLTLNVIPGGFYNTGLQRLNMKDTLRVLLIDSTCNRSDSARVILDSVTFSANVSFTNAPTGLYYIYVYHRNHITVSSRLKQSIIRGSTVSYNFTADSTSAFGNNMIRVSNSPLRYGMIPGDANRDEYVDGLDQTIWINQNGLDGYQPADFNGDFFVDGLDQTIWILNNGASSNLPCFFIGPVGSPEKPAHKGVRENQ